METEILSSDSYDALTRALSVLSSGGLVAFPTDTVYGLGALAFDAEAVKTIYTVKGRPAEKGIPILLGDVDDLFKVTSDTPEIALRLIVRFWPGPLTLVLPKISTLPEAVSGTATVAVRVPDHLVARTLLRAAGPLAVTSANLSGEPSPFTAQTVFAQLGGRISLILDGGKSPGDIPSTVVDCTGTQPLILRAGPISREELFSAVA
jgi:L-threonylcarbamoyladenylate synthase